MARRSEHSQDEIRAMILNAAEAIVTENGYTELKVRSIAMDIGYTVGSIYMLFDNLADLILHLKARTLDDLNAYLRQLPAEDSPQHALQTLALAYFNFAQQHYHRWQLVFEHHLTQNKPLPDWYLEKFEPLYEPIQNQFQTLAAQTSAKELKLSAQAFLGGVHGICNLLMPLHHGDELPYNNQIELAVTLFVESFVQGWLKLQH